jgi:hypothetical protein
MKFNRMEWIAGSTPQRVHSVWVINKVFSHYQEENQPTYIDNRVRFVSDMIEYLDL